MSSRHRHKRSHSRDSRKEASSKRKKSPEQQDKLDAILASLTDLKSDITSCNSRISEIEAKNAILEAAFCGPANQPADHEENTDDQLSFVAGNEFNEDNEDVHAFDAGTELSDTVTKPPDTAIKPPNTAIKPPNTTIMPPSTAVMSTNSPPPSSPTNGQMHAEESSAVLFDPEVQANSWSPSLVFHNFLEKQFRKKLSYEQVCDILEEQAIPSVDSLVAPTLDHSVINQIPAHNKKYVQERDKELSVIQRSMLNATGPLCTLHDRLENNFDINPSELKLVVEQTLCLLGSANTQLSVLHRKKVLASVNKSKIELANQPLPNAKKWLFGEEFPAIASKEADLARGLAKNLGQNAPKHYTKPVDFKTSTGINSHTNYNKYQNFFGPAAAYRGKTTPLSRTMESSNVRSGNFQPITRTPQGVEPILDREIQDLLAKGAITQIPLSKDGYYSRIFLVPKKDGGMRPVIDLSSLNNFVENQHFQMENLTSVKTLLKQGDFMTKLDLKDAYLTVAINPQSQRFLRFSWKGKAYQFKALPFAKAQPPIQRPYPTNTGFQNGISMVVDELAAGKWQPNSGATPRCNNIHGCFEKGLGCDLQQCKKKWQMVFSREPATYQHSGIKRGITSSTISAEEPSQT